MPPLDQPCPTDFAYAQALRKPRVKALRALSKVLLFADAVPSDEYMCGFVADMYTGDPVAERFVDEVMEGPLGRQRARKLLDRALQGGIEALPDAPDAMRALFNEFETVPDWVDRALIEEGAAIWRLWGRTLFNVGGAETLEMYTESAVALPLSLTGGYAGENALRRFLETTRFWMDVSDPGALFRIGSDGRATAMRVRVMHVSVRRRVIDHPEWQVERWGIPISQAWMYMTLMGGSVAPALIMWPLGWLTTPHEIRALMHFQRYLGYLLGCQPRAFPETVRSGMQTLNAVAFARTFTAGRHGAELIESFAPAFAPRSTRKFTLGWLRELYEYRLMCGYVSLYMMRGTRRRHAVPSAVWRAVPIARTPLVLLSEIARHLVPGASELQERHAVKAAEAWYARQMNGRTAAFEASSALRR